LLLIECAGIPGSGKSHIADLLRARLTTSGIPYADLAELLLSEGARDKDSIPHRGSKIDLGNKDSDVLLKSFRRFLLEEPDYALNYLRAVIELEPSASVQDLVLSSFTYCCAQRGFFLARRDRVNARLVLHEEGFAHRLFTLFGYRSGDTRYNRDLEQLAESMPLPHTLFWSRCSPAIAIDRLRRRVRKTPDRLVGMGAQDVEGLLALADQKLETAMGILAKRGARVAEVDTEQIFDEAALFEGLLSDVSDGPR